MGCDIHPKVEVKDETGEWRNVEVPPRLQDRTYGRFAFLTGGVVRNYSQVPPVLPQPRGFPPREPEPVAEREDDGMFFVADDDDYNYNHSASNLSLAELLAVDYDQIFCDRRDRYGRDLPAGENVSLREFLGEGWFSILKALGNYGAPENVRILFDFDS